MESQEKQSAARKYLGRQRERLTKAGDNEPQKFVYYVLPASVRAKFERIIGEEPDFGLIPEGIPEQGRKRVFNDGTYVLFQIDEDGKARIIKTEENKHRRSRKSKREDGMVAWDTQEVGDLFFK